MSLHVGHIPPHIKNKQLERVFHKFGRCTLQMKDGYAFAVFEVSDDAEAALRTLRGKRICGEQLSLNWSKKQPRPFQRSTWPTKFYEPYRRRKFRGEDHGVGMRVSRDRRDFSAGNSRIPAYKRGKHRDEVLDRGAGYVHEDIDEIGEERGVALKGRVTDVGNSSEPNPVAIDSWGEPVGDGIAGTKMHNDDEFDRYEPYHGYDREDEKEGNQMASSYGSPYHGSPQGNGQKEHPDDEADKNIDNSKPQRACYKCGLEGHIKHRCPERDTKGEKFGKFSHRRGEMNFRGRNDGKLKMPRTSSWGRPDSRDPLISSHQEQDKIESHSGKSRKLVKSKNFSERSEKNSPKLRAESKAKKQSKQEHETRKKVLKKRSSRRFKSRSDSSDSSSSSSQTRSQTSKSKSRTSSHSTSRSIFSRSRSVSCSSRSASVSSFRKSKSTRSSSRSRSSLHRSPSLSVSLDKEPPYSSLKLNVSEDRASPMDKLEQPLIPDSKHHLNDSMENFEAEDGNSPVTHKVNCETDGDHAGDNIDKARYSALTSGYEESNSGINLTKDIAVVSENHREKSNWQETLLIKPNEQIAVGSEGRIPTRITTQEMIFALKHYGHPAPEEGEPGLSVEGYFGAARLWPWEMIYYRRFKKGPISTENYARRLEQNKEFGIVDRYIRSSSGWGEQERNHMI